MSNLNCIQLFLLFLMLQISFIFLSMYVCTFGFITFCVYFTTQLLTECCIFHKPRAFGESSSESSSSSSSSDSDSPNSSGNEGAQATHKKKKKHKKKKTHHRHHHHHHCDEEDREGEDDKAAQHVCSCNDISDNNDNTKESGTKEMGELKQPPKNIYEK